MCTTREIQRLVDKKYPNAKVTHLIYCHEKMKKERTMGRGAGSKNENDKNNERKVHIMKENAKKTEDGSRTIVPVGGRGQPTKNEPWTQPLAPLLSTGKSPEKLRGGAK